MGFLLDSDTECGSIIVLRTELSLPFLLWMKDPKVSISVS